MSAWVELIDRDSHKTDSELLGLLRSAQHADKKGFENFMKKLRSEGA